MCLRAAEKKKMEDVLRKIAVVLISPVLADTRTAWQNSWSQSFCLHFTFTSVNHLCSNDAVTRRPCRKLSSHSCFMFRLLHIFDAPAVQPQVFSFTAIRLWEEVLCNFLCTATCFEDVFFCCFNVCSYFTRVVTPLSTSCFSWLADGGSCNAPFLASSVDLSGGLIIQNKWKHLCGCASFKKISSYIGRVDNCVGAPDLAHVLLCQFNKKKVFTEQNVSQFLVDHH